MPEGDTIYKLARYIAPRLEGRALTSFRLRGDSSLDLVGRRVQRVAARGKHLQVTIEGDLVLHTHLGMHGSWHRYSPGEAWTRPDHQASVVLETDRDVIVCFNAQESECLRAGGAREARALGHLGPDLAAEAEPDLEEVVARARRLLEGSAPLVDVLLHQGIACGLGNVYKSELLFLHGLLPLRDLDSVDDARLSAVFRDGRDLLRRNLHGGPRTTRFVEDGAGRLWVYSRRDAECLKCGAPIQRERQGRGRRVTYWCPICQS